MRAIVRNLTILLLAAPLFAADEHSAVVDLFASLTSALVNDNPAGFMRAFDKTMPDYDKLRSDIEGLVAEAEVSSDVEPVKDEGDEAKRTVDLDWILDIHSRELAGPAVRRHETVHAVLVKDKKSWKIASIAPIDFFRPAKFSLAK